MKELITVFLTITLSFSMLAGCGGPSGSAPDSKPAAEETAKPAAEKAANGETSTTPQADIDKEFDFDLNATRLAHSDLEPIPQLIVEGDISSEELEELDRMARAYTPSADSPLVNKAQNFYYYSQMNEDEQAIYDAMLMCVSDPTTSDNVTIANIHTMLDPLDLEEEIDLAYFGMLYDHPELFWIYSDEFMKGTECSMKVTTHKKPDSDETTQVICKIDEPFEKFEERIEEFNNAVDTFLADIDLSQSEDQIALQIHDKLIDTVDYNYRSIQERSETKTDIAHTAYAALVKDSNGTPNCAVCDGYSLAYVYLLQQVGIEATVILGEGRNAEEEKSARGHAWSAVKLDDEWYEVDTTWNDCIDGFETGLEQYKDSNPKEYEAIKESLQDKDYRFKLEHELYNLTTEEMTEHYGRDYDEYFTYNSSQGMQFSLASNLLHYRANDEKATLLEDYSKLMDLAPQATGTKYKMY